MPSSPRKAVITIPTLVGATAHRHQSFRVSFEDEMSVFSQYKMHGRYGQRWTSHGASLTDPRKRNQRCIAACSKPVLSILEAKCVSNEKTPTDGTRTGTHFIILVHHGLCSIACIPVSTDVEWYYDFRILDVPVPQSECYTVPDPHAGKKAVTQGCSFSHGSRTQRPARNKRDRWRGLPDIRCVDVISYEWMYNNSQSERRSACFC
ncbi:hypothetical protein ARMSODRAFT_100934 [Armillaria solidipes]|uniref:Uncharacterized protein n=1 Tax=Armillaria solidipes TaxID=1076256 RepID=A0A2H3AV54_9AGAR|nr:hypothetical protein ARMSODRAFT_100934 [Armillaria solidipes]